jgi:hypothetical protein
MLTGSPKVHCSECSRPVPAGSVSEGLCYSCQSITPNTWAKSIPGLFRRLFGRRAQPSINLDELPRFRVESFDQAVSFQLQSLILPPGSPLQEASARLADETTSMLAASYTLGRSYRAALRIWSRHVNAAAQAKL